MQEPEAFEGEASESLIFDYGGTERPFSLATNYAITDEELLEVEAKQLE